EALGLAGTPVEGTALPSLATLPRLGLLDLADTDVKGNSIEQLTACRRLTALNLENCPLVVDDSTRHLPGLKFLKGLVLRKTGFESESITGKGLVAIGTIRGLEHLNLSATRINDESLPSLAKLGQLRFLHLGLTGVSNAGLAQLAKLPRLESLNLTYQEGFGGTKVDAGGLGQLATYPALRRLDLTGIKIGDKDVSRFRVLKQLTRLTVSGTMIGSEGLRQLRQTLPGCEVVR
ncbi:MAG: hypothetical protein QF363_15645, partial [Planctomycetaceae bacterium]|nr:hypothetical protein [Planctomycetaceae bacterium]